MNVLVDKVSREMYRNGGDSESAAREHADRRGSGLVGKTVPLEDQHTTTFGRDQKSFLGFHLEQGDVKVSHY